MSKKPSLPWAIKLFSPLSLICCLICPPFVEFLSRIGCFPAHVSSFSSVSKHLRNLSNICSVPELYLKCLLVCVWTDSCFFLLLFSQGNFLSLCVYVCVCVHLCIVKLHFYPRTQGVYQTGINLNQILSVFFSDNMHIDQKNPCGWLVTDIQVYFFTSVRCQNREWR